MLNRFDFSSWHIKKQTGRSKLNINILQMFCNKTLSRALSSSSRTKSVFSTYTNKKIHLLKTPFPRQVWNVRHSVRCMFWDAAQRPDCFLQEREKSVAATGGWGVAPMKGHVWPRCRPWAINSVHIPQSPSHAAPRLQLEKSKINQCQMHLT